MLIMHSVTTLKASQFDLLQVARIFLARIGEFGSVAETTFQGWVNKQVALKLYRGPLVDHPDMQTYKGAPLLARGTVLIFRPDFALEDAIGSHACSFEASMHGTQLHASRAFAVSDRCHHKHRRNTAGAAQPIGMVIGGFSSFSAVIVFAMVLLGMHDVAGSLGLNSTICSFQQSMPLGGVPSLTPPPTPPPPVATPPQH